MQPFSDSRYRAVHQYQPARLLDAEPFSVPVLSCYSDGAQQSALRLAVESLPVFPDDALDGGVADADVPREADRVELVIVPILLDGAPAALDNRLTGAALDVGNRGCDATNCAIASIQAFA